VRCSFFTASGFNLLLMPHQSKLRFFCERFWDQAYSIYRVCVHKFRGISLLCAAAGNPADVCSKSEQFMEKSYSSLRKLLRVARENQNFVFAMLKIAAAA
jgi:hypothetical protein